MCAREHVSVCVVVQEAEAGARVSGSVFSDLWLCLTFFFFPTRENDHGSMLSREPVKSYVTVCSE